MSEDRLFVCALCNRGFLSTWSQEQLEAEYAKAFPKDSEEDRDVVCDACYQFVLQNVSGDIYLA